MLECVNYASIKLIEWGGKTTSSIRGHTRWTRLNIAILRLARAIFPQYGGIVAPALSSLCGYRDLCGSVSFIPSVASIIKSKKISISEVFDLVSSLYSTVSFLQAVKILPSFSSLAKMAQSIGSTGAAAQSAFRPSLFSYIANNPMNTWEILECSFGMGTMAMAYFQAKTPAQRARAISADKLILFSCYVGRLTVLGLGVAGVQAPIFIASLNVAIAVGNYVRFLRSAPKPPPLSPPGS
ncbi:hypothetical protein [Candidatus Protochlamydia phocaeensis]|uniref:hypothetical protein n=1 Tax=Candidatus Protochlamydia phocaeensis TaxID=1414722 RepID=UPI0008391288|nr:hypothetical protein [Candidatus Protochlamydia phocaeensis]